MTNLATLQRLFWQAMVHPTGVGDYLKQADAETNALFAVAFEETATFSRVERLEVYANAYFYRLHDALAELFPVVRAALGRAGFHNLITDYLLAHPSDDPNLHHLGERLPAFLESYRPDASTEAGFDRACLAEFARIEQALTRALDAEDAALMTRNSLATVPVAAWPQLPLALVPAVVLIESRFDFRTAHSQTLQQQAPPCLELGDALTVVWRRGYQALFRRVDQLEAQLLRMVAGEVTFEGLCETAADAGQPPRVVVELLLRWLDDQLIIGASALKPLRFTSPERT